MNLPGTEAAENMSRRNIVAVLIPCHNEAAAIGKVISDFRAALPNSVIHVCDNNSTDGTGTIAAECGAIVRFEPLAGKGNAVRRMFSDVDADVYVLVDGDDTYDHAKAPELVRRLIDDSLDMVVGSRAATSGRAYRKGHRLGNYVLTKIVRVVFGDRISDMLSGYRVFSRRFVKSFPALTEGFDIETELTVHALELRMPMVEVETAYKERPPASFSKLSTYGDGWRILRTILTLIKEERPFGFFGGLGFLLAVTSVILAWPLLLTYLETGLVPRLPTAVLSMGLMLLAFLSVAAGAILDTVTRGRREMKRLAYLGIPSVNGDSALGRR